MASILDTFCGVAQESTYGTAIASGFRGYEAQSDTFTREVQYVESVGFRQALQTTRFDRHDTISIGASGSIEADGGAGGGSRGGGSGGGAVFVLYAGTLSNSGSITAAGGGGGGGNGGAGGVHTFQISE